MCPICSDWCVACQHRITTSAVICKICAFTTFRPEVGALRLTLLLAHTNSPTSPTRGLAMLPTNPQAPVVTQTTMSPDFLKPLEIFAQFGFHAVGQHLRVFAVDNVALSIEEPGRDLVLRGVLDDGDDAFEFFRRDFTGSEETQFISIKICFRGPRVCISPLIQINISLLADQVGVATADTLDAGQGVHDLLLAIDIGVKETQNELEVRLLAADERHAGQCLFVDDDGDGIEVVFDCESQSRKLR
jgi:hypothetical protein